MPLKATFGKGFVPGLSRGVWSPLSPGLGQAGGPVPPGAWSVCPLPTAHSADFLLLQFPAEAAHTGGDGAVPPCSAPPEQSNNNHHSCSCCGQKSLQQPVCSAGDTLWAGSCEHLDPRECSNGRRVAGQISGDASHRGGWSSFRGVVLELGNASANRLLSSLPTGIWVKKSFFQGHPGPG